MSTATLVPVKEYLETSYRPDSEYLEGELLERNVGEYDHSSLQGMLVYYLIANSGKWGIKVLPEQRVQAKANRFRVPDISVVLAGEHPGQIIKTPPFLCVEIVSPADRLAEMQERIDDYLNFGVPYVWLIYPTTRRAFVYTRDGVAEVKDGVLKTQNPDIYVPLAEL
jgi:Uma2 family endonuclease